MRISSSVWATLFLAAIAGVGCNSNSNSNQRVSNAPVTPASVPTASVPSNVPSAAPQAPETIHADGVRRITTVELRDLLAKGEALVIDVRTETSFNQGHIPGARLIPVEDVLAQSKSLPKNKLIVTYCS